MHPESQFSVTTHESDDEFPNLNLFEATPVGCELEEQGQSVES